MSFTKKPKGVISTMNEQTYLNKSGTGESEEGYHDAGRWDKDKADQLAKTHGGRVEHDPSGKYLVILSESTKKLIESNKSSDEIVSNLTEASFMSFQDKMRRYHKANKLATELQSWRIFDDVEKVWDEWSLSAKKEITQNGDKGSVVLGGGWRIKTPNNSGKGIFVPAPMYGQGNLHWEKDASKYAKELERRLGSDFEVFVSYGRMD